ncbi:MFS transporter [Streptomonospora nanhaiensis]|uniref:MFS transporter n=1 Tax=Streptomonospora nanhaiensis TaxID=1323731 RepID=UPI001C9A0EDE|nr:MFS transporter [Streptomonospora nanhaiensis]MBX9388410.1 MFS transporter [Streptomonospora nanhaiensis]
MHVLTPAMDLIRFAALLSVPAAYVLGVLSFAQLLVVAVVAATADIAFRAAHGAFLKWLVPPEELVAANARLESATWTATIAGPPLGGAVAGLLGPVATLAADAISYLLSAVGLRAVGGREPRPGAPDREPPKTAAPAEAATPARESRVPRMRAADLADGWRYVLADPVLRPLFLNTVPVNSLIMATAPLMSVLMLDDLGFAPWQYGLAFALPCVGGLIGARLAQPLVARFGRRAVLVGSGIVRVCWPVGLVFVGPGTAGLVLVVAVQLALVTSIGVFNPVSAAFRLDRTPPERVARVLTAWTVTGKAAVAAATAAAGLLAGATDTRTAVAVAGLLLLATPLPLLCLRDARTPAEEREQGRDQPRSAVRSGRP